MVNSREVTLDDDDHPLKETDRNQIQHEKKNQQDADAHEGQSGRSSQLIMAGIEN
jgi:hypothetical protein